MLALLTACAAELVVARGGPAQSLPVDLDIDAPTAPVQIEGRVLFTVRGVSAYSAQTRADTIAARIAALAADPRFTVDHVHIVESQHSTDIKADQRLVVGIVDADAAVEGVDRYSLALAYVERVRAAIESYRQDRRPEELRLAVLRAAIATAIFVTSLYLLLRLARRFTVLVERRCEECVPAIALESLHILHAQRVWSTVRTGVRTLRVAAILILTYLYLPFVLGLFPWTRAAAHRLLGYFMDPLARIGGAVLADLPNLVFLTVVIVAARYVLRLLRLFFHAVEHGTVTLSDFDPEWALPAFKVARFGVLAFALVIAYPYIPGSNSEAFKGMSIFVGLILSIGSTSFIANLVAGYTLIYLRAFKPGDLVKVDEEVGEVIALRLQATYLRTLKNEEVILPNSLVLNNLIVNYSALAREQGLILHTTVGIGYETPWRQVEAMLLLAAQRTPGLLPQPKAFVLQKALGDFSITYELNVFCSEPRTLPELYTRLHRRILDVFNEYGVQIMTPAYRDDPDLPKIVPGDSWFAAPADRGSDPT